MKHTLHIKGFSLAMKTDETTLSPFLLVLWSNESVGLCGEERR